MTNIREDLRDLRMSSLLSLSKVLKWDSGDDKALSFTLFFGLELDNNDEIHRLYF